MLQATRLDGFFELLVGGDTLSHKKPHASVLDHVRRVFDCQLLQMAHVGDSRIDVQAARNTEPIAASLPDQLFDTLPAIAHHVATLGSRPRH